jgi:hypothetical protein
MCEAWHRRDLLREERIRDLMNREQRKERPRPTPIAEDREREEAPDPVREAEKILTTAP